MQGSFKVEQALFGYREGHNLVAASVLLAPRVRQFLADVTDVSGPESSVGFEAPYTGLAVPGTHFYALFRTWPAPEMPRPGCVWSHALLIDFADFEGMSDLSLLRKLYLRPTVPLDLSNYETALKVPASKGHIGIEDSQQHHRLAVILRGLYEHPESGVVILDKKSSVWESAVFTVWSQQWPRLRRTFSFSTGSLGDRRLGGVGFDLQIAPLSSHRLWGRGGSPTFVVDYSIPTSDAGTSSWLVGALEDLLHADKQGFRSFLRRYEADLGAHRAAFASLARIHLSIVSLTEEGSWIDTLRTIAAEFPKPEEALTLKQASVIASSSSPSEGKLDRLTHGIQFLCTEEASGAFAQVDVDFAAVVTELWPTRRESLMAILAKPPLREDRWSALARAIADRIRGDEIRWLWETHPEMLATLVRLNPSLAEVDDVWRLPDRAQWIVVEALEGADVSGESWRHIVAAMLTVETTVAVRDITQRAGVDALYGALLWLEKVGPIHLPPPLWREALRPLAENHLENHALPPLELAFCAAIVPPSIAGGLPATRPDVQVLASISLDELPTALRLPTAFLLVALGLQTSAAGARLLARGFFPVYEALEGAVEPPEAWRLLQPHLPMLWFWEEWDRCEKLRRGLENWMRANPESREIIVEAARRSKDRKWLESIS